MLINNPIFLSLSTRGYPANCPRRPLASTILKYSIVGNSKRAFSHSSENSAQSVESAINPAKTNIGSFHSSISPLSSMAACKTMIRQLPRLLDGRPEKRDHTASEALIARLHHIPYVGYGKCNIAPEMVWPRQPWTPSLVFKRAPPKRPMLRPEAVIAVEAKD